MAYRPTFQVTTITCRWEWLFWFSFVMLGQFSSIWSAANLTFLIVNPFRDYFGSHLLEQWIRCRECFGATKFTWAGAPEPERAQEYTLYNISVRLKVENENLEWAQKQTLHDLFFLRNNNWSAKNTRSFFLWLRLQQILAPAAWAGTTSRAPQISWYLLTKCVLRT